MILGVVVEITEIGFTKPEISWTSFMPGTNTRWHFFL
jgi:hypothetical protein